MMVSMMMFDHLHGDHVKDHVDDEYGNDGFDAAGVSYYVTVLMLKMVTMLMVFVMIMLVMMLAMIMMFVI